MSYPIPLKVLDEQHSIHLGKTGAGKSFAVAGEVERFLDHKQRTCVVDPKGDFWGLKAAPDGKGPGYPIVLFGNFKNPQAQDIPIYPQNGAEVAELVVSGNRPCVIGFRGWQVADRTRFWIDFANVLFNKNAAPLKLVIDEVHNFAPQGKILDPLAGQCLHWTNRLASEGRGIGITLVMASQRPAKVHKDTLTCAETLIAMRATHPLDRQAFADWIDGCGDPERGKMVMANLAQLKRGEAFVWSPEAEFFERIKFPKIRTFDSYKAPTMDERAISPKGWAEVNLDDVKAKMAKAIETKQANDPALLKKEIAGLRAELAKKQPAKVEAPKVNEKAIREDERDKVLKATIKAIAAQKIVDTETRATALTFYNNLKKFVDDHLSKFANLPANRHDKFIAELQKELGKSSREYQVTKVTVQPVHHVKGPTPTVPDDGEPLPKGELAVLKACAQHAASGCDRSELTILTGYKRSSRDAYIGRLMAKGFIDNDGAKLHASQTGIAKLGPDFEPLPTGQKLIEHYNKTLPTGEAAIFDFLLNQDPSRVSRDQITERTGYARSSRDAYIQRLKAKHILDINSEGVKLNDKLFS